MRTDDERLVWAYPACPSRSTISSRRGPARAAGGTCGLHLEISNILVLALPTVPPWVALFKLYGWYMFSTAVVLTAMIIALAATRRPAEDERVTVAS